MAPLKQIIHENTGISIGIVITICTSIFYISTLYAEVKSGKEEIKETKQMQQEYNRNAIDINKRLGRIEGMLEHVNRGSK